MKAIAIHGSPRKGMNSDTLVARFLEGFRAAGHRDVTEFYANELRIRPCQGCEACSRPPDYRCAIRDDMDAIYEAFVDADVVVFSTPMYWGYMTAQLKAVVDRMEAIAHPKSLRGKRFVLIATYRHHVESTVAFFHRVFPFFGGEVHVLTCRTMDEATHDDLPISRFPEKLGEAFDLGKRLGEAPPRRPGEPSRPS
jgi:multimeric flavodoxin WrbA